MTSSLLSNDSAAPRTRGQVMVLGCVALIVLALMMATSFTLTNAVHEKIRIQSHADAQAYSLATVEARAFNVTAHYNRAIAAALVAQMSLHSWMAIATHDVAMLSSGAIIMLTIAGIEAAMGCYPYNVSHCPCVIQAIISAFKFFRAASKWGNTLKGLESQFNKGVEGLVKMVQSLHKGQLNVLKRAKGEIMYGLVMQSLQSNNAKKSSYVLALGNENKKSFACALEGTDMDDDCDGSWKRSKASLAERSKVIQNTANASRPFFDRIGAQSSMLSHQNFRGPNDPDVPKNSLTDGNWNHFFVTRARVGEGTSSGSDNGKQAKNVGAGTMGMGFAVVRNFKHSPPVGMPFDGQIYSGQQNKHSGLLWMSGHSGSHDKFEHVMAQEPCNDQSCFVNFRQSSDPDQDFGAPTVYGGVKQNLRYYAVKGDDFKENAPWEINSDGKVKLKLSKDKDAEINMVPRGEGVALAKAKVYFHQLGNWKIPPNFFDPFWRSKLHFFKADELQTALGLAGDTKGIQLHSAGRAPVEGVDQ